MPYGGDPLLALSKRHWEGHVADFALPHALAGKSIFDMFEERARARPNALCLTATSPREGEAHLTFEQMRWRATKFAGALRALQVNCRDHVGLMLDNEAALEGAVTMLALHRLGGVVVPINARFAADEIVYVMTKARCRVLVIMARLLPMLATVRHRLPMVEVVIVVGATMVDAQDGHDWHKLYADSHVAAEEWPRISPNAVSEILFTSGTTAHPKGAVMTHTRSLVTAYGFAAALSLDQEDVYQSFFPFFTTAALHCVLLPAWWAGAAAVLDPKLDMNGVMARMERERTTKYIGAPSFYIFLLEAYDPTLNDLSRIRMFNSGGAAISVKVMRRLASVFPAVDLRQTYGQTESGPAGTVATGTDTASRPGTVGKPWPLTEIQIIDDDGTVLPHMIKGEIAVRSPSVMREYFDEMALTKATMLGDWLRTGDLGYVDADGYLYHVDRKKDMIIRGGHNIGSLEVEESLFSHPAVQEVAVVAVPHDRLGEDIHAFVILRSGHVASAGALREHLVDKVADYKIPRGITFMEELPRGPMGKVLKSELRRKAILLLKEAI